MSRTLKRATTGVLFSCASRVKWLWVGLIFCMGSPLGNAADTSLEIKLEIQKFELKLFKLMLSTLLSLTMHRSGPVFQRP